MFAKRFLPAVFLCGCVWLPAGAQQQEADSVSKTVSLDGVVVSAGSYHKAAERASSLPLEIADERFLRQHFTGNITQTLEHLPGVHSMDIGQGFSKPVIRGMGFNRISVAENGIKQEGQQWGADHGLEIDAFGVGRITVRKGPASLLYGSDAMGGAIEISQSPPPEDNRVFGEAVVMGRSVNDALGGSLMLGIRHDGWYARLRYTEQRFADYRLPADTVVYLSQRMPVEGRRLKNTAGFERDASLYAGYKTGAYASSYTLSRTFQKTGFFPGAHGIPDASRLADDGDARNIDLPYSLVEHLKAASRQQYVFGDGRATAWIDLGYQRNDREEWSLFHTHYTGQKAPEKDPDRELAFTLDTYSASARLRLFSPGSRWEHTAGWDVQAQRNRVGGYSFLLPSYDRFTAGALWLTSYHPSPELSISAGIRYDYGRIRSDAYTDPYLMAYLTGRGYTGEALESYRWRSYPVSRRFGDFSGSVGFVWTPGGGAHQFKSNIGRSFRLPGAAELASNGVHHGAFRHEQGSPMLSSEQGWQLDAGYTYESASVRLSVSPFFAWFSNYIYLRPTGEWSALPHAGQIYRYTGAEAVFAGAEASLRVGLTSHLAWELTAEYVYTYNVDERVALSFSPPAGVRNTLSWTGGGFSVSAELQSVASQRRVARNEEATPGVHLIHAQADYSARLGRTRVGLTLSVHNMLNTAFLNHLSFYRKAEIPEPGRNISLIIKLPF
ncbi:MAG: TonB-dependent receptor [Tannerellaceae bacterium]|jgi:iron complex outermembrane receptor protein|nr:TonB-dependent receptor [Tannerellaceae bacterium]